MVIHVCERAARSGALSVHVATDDPRIAQAVRAHGHLALMTRSGHATGTDRIAEAVTQLAPRLSLDDDAIVVNVQGDEPLIPPALIAAVAGALAGNLSASVATACHPLEDLAAMFDPNVVKVVLSAAGEALYFSRAPIPWARDAFARSPRVLPAGAPCYRHLGIYAYRVGFLKHYAGLAPAPLEEVESLEQLRVLWHGYRIAVAVSQERVPPGVDTPQDLCAVRRMLES